MEERSKSIKVIELCRYVGMLYKHTMAKGFEKHGITAPQGMIIGILSHSGQRKISELSEKMGLTNSTVSGIVDRLEQQNIVERIRCKEDRRVVYVRLTPEYKGLHQDFHKKAEQSVSDILSKATQEEVEKIIEGLNILKKLLEDQA